MKKSGKHRINRATHAETQKTSDFHYVIWLQILNVHFLKIQTMIELPISIICEFEVRVWDGSQSDLPVIS